MTCVTYHKYLLFASMLFFAACSYAKNWSEITTPTANPAMVYGSYTAGCMDGAAALPLKGQGYEVQNPARNRFYGHPDLVGFLEKYAEANYQQTKHNLYIGDLAQPRGGPVPGGHGSHQVGLDADIWYGKDGDLPLELLTKDKKSLDESAWQNFDASILKNAANFPKVERIFVNPRIKQKLCETHKGEAWLGKIRPWWNHSDHFHVRISCPAGDEFCSPQAAPDKGDGCDASLDWWFSDEAKVGVAKKDAKPLVLPKQCDGVFGG